MMLWLDRIHRWTGAFIGALLAVLGLTGTLLLYEDAWLRATVPHAADAKIDDAAAAVVAARFMSDETLRPTSVQFPTEKLGVFRLSFEGGGGAYADQTGEVVLRWTSKWERVELWVFDLHHHVFMGDAGTTVVGILALVGLAFVVTGVVLWWRTRKFFAPRVLPSKLSRLQIVKHHRDLGLVMAPLLISQFLTGAMIALRPVAQFVLAPLSSELTITASLAAPDFRGGPQGPVFDWGRMLETVRSTYPEAQLRTLNVARSVGQLIRIRVRQPGEWLPNGRTIFWFDPADGRLVESRDARTLPLATRAYNLLYPVHASSVGGVVYKAFLTAAGLALTLLGSLAVYGFWSYQLRRSAAFRPQPA